MTNYGFVFPSCEFWQKLVVNGPCFHTMLRFGCTHSFHIHNALEKQRISQPRITLSIVWSTKSTELHNYKNQKGSPNLSISFHGRKNLHFLIAKSGRM